MPRFIPYRTDEGREFMIPELKTLKDESTEDFLQREKDPITRAVALAAILLVEFNLTEAPTFTVEGLDAVFRLSRKSAGYSVDQCIGYFTEIEDYEMCDKLLNVKSKL
jgi:hypothetical protein